MTTIAYKAGVLATDTKAHDDNGLVFKSKKIDKLKNGSYLGSAGDSDIRDLLAVLNKATLLKMPTKSKLSSLETQFQGLWCWPSGEIFRIEIYEENNKWISEILPILDPYAACGTGGAYALGAMLAGKSAIEAVKIACKLDNGSGLPVESVSISDAT